MNKNEMNMIMIANEIIFGENEPTQENIAAFAAFADKVKKKLSAPSQGELNREEIYNAVLNAENLTDEFTAKEASEETGFSVAKLSYHLNALAKLGKVEVIEGEGKRAVKKYKLI